MVENIALFFRRIGSDVGWRNILKTNNSYLLKIGIGQLSTMDADTDIPVTPLASSRSFRSIDLTILEMDRERRVRRIEERKKSMTQFMPNQSKMHCFPPAL